MGAALLGSAVLFPAVGPMPACPPKRPGLTLLAGWLLGGLCGGCGGQDPPLEVVASPHGEPLQTTVSGQIDGSSAPSWIQLSELSDQSGRIVSPSLVSDGFMMPGGHSVILEVPVGFQAALRFSLALQAQDMSQLPRELNVLWDGQPLSIGPLPESTTSAIPYRAALPGTADGEQLLHRLEFSVPPGEGIVMIHGPAIQPLKAVAREPDPARPDVILFVADTFRADDLDHPGLTPRLEAFAETARRFTQARSPSTWTLPSVASLLYGVHPGQHGGVHLSRQPQSPAATLAETFAAAGYRTVAVTDSAFVSRRYGLDRGFEWFQELHSGDLPTTLDVAQRLLDADDGRPLLMMVHSYHTHTPYTPSIETRALLEEQLGVPDDGRDFAWFEAALDALTAEAVALGEETDDIREQAATLAAALSKLRLATVRELDTSFGELLDLLDDRGLADDALIVFTSDHGEAFYEHGRLYHGQGAYDEVLRVPLLLRAPSLTPETVIAPVSLVDITPTLAQLADLPADGLWSRPTLLDPKPDRVVFSFNWPDADSLPLMSVVANELKIVSTADPEQLAQGRLLWVFDLANDPGEQVDIAPQRQQQLAPWVKDLAPRVAELLTPLQQSSEVELDAGHTDLLRQLGYIGDDH